MTNVSGAQTLSNWRVLLHDEQGKQYEETFRSYWCPEKTSVEEIKKACAAQLTVEHRSQFFATHAELIA